MSNKPLALPPPAAAEPSTSSPEQPEAVAAQGEATPPPAEPQPTPEAPPTEPLPPDPVASIEAHQLATGTAAWLHAAALRRERWGLGRELPRSVYLAAVTKAAAHPCGV